MLAGIMPWGEWATAQVEQSDIGRRSIFGVSYFYFQAVFDRVLHAMPAMECLGVP